LYIYHDDGSMTDGAVFENSKKITMHMHITIYTHTNREREREREREMILETKQK
jgi:hypothetical protein